MPDAGPSFVSFLRRSLAVLAAETPEIERRFRHRLGGHAVEIEVDGDQIRLEFDGPGRRFPDQATAPGSSVRVRTDRATILDLIEARIALPDAVISGRLAVRGRPSDLLDFFEGLEFYLHGAVRAPSFRELLDGYR